MNIDDLPRRYIDRRTAVQSKDSGATEMPSWRTEIEGASIILLGKFNPAIFQPAWLSANNLLRKEEADIANIDVINPQVTSFSAAWLRIQVLAGRFQATYR